MFWILLGVMLFNFAITFLTLSAVGNSLTTLRADIAEGFSHQVWQHRVSRQALISECKKIDGYKEPPTMEQQLESMMTHWSERTKAKVQA